MRSRLRGCLPRLCAHLGLYLRLVICTAFRHLHCYLVTQSCVTWCLRGAELVGDLSAAMSLGAEYLAKKDLCMP